MWLVTLCRPVHRSQNKYIKNTEYFSECVHQKCRRNTCTLKIFDVCTQEKRQVICYTYLRNNAPVPTKILILNLYPYLLRITHFK